MEGVEVVWCFSLLIDFYGFLVPLTGLRVAVQCSVMWRVCVAWRGVGACPKSTPSHLVPDLAHLRPFLGFVLVVALKVR